MSEILNQIEEINENKSKNENNDESVESVTLKKGEIENTPKDDNSEENTNSEKRIIKEEEIQNEEELIQPRNNFNTLLDEKTITKNDAIFNNKTEIKEKKVTKAESKMKEILNTFTDQKKDSKVIKQPFNQEINNTIIYPSNKKKIESDNDKVERIEKEINKKSKEGLKLQLETDHTERDIQYYDYDDNIYSKNSASLITSLNMTRSMIENFNNLSKTKNKQQSLSNNQPSRVDTLDYTGVYSTNSIGRYINKPTSPNKIGDPKPKEDINAYITPTNDYFYNLYSKIKTEKGNISILNDKIKKVGMIPLPIQIPSSQSYKMPENLNQNTNDNIKIAENITINKENQTISNQLKSLKDEMTKSKIESKLSVNKERLEKLKNINVPNVNLKDEESKKNYASAIKQNLNEITEKKKENDKNRGDYFASVDDQIDQLFKKQQEKEEHEEKKSENKEEVDSQAEVKIASD